MSKQLFPHGTDSACAYVAAAAIALLLFGQIRIVSRMDDGLSPVADAYSEANAIRSGEGYAAKGFLADMGLPDSVFGSRFPESGTERSSRSASSIYTHYPPGPNWIASVLTEIFGIGNIGRFRLFPIFIGGIASAYFAASLFSSIGAIRGLAVFLLCADVPMFSVMMHGLHYQGYAFSLLLIELGILLRGLHSDSMAVNRCALCIAVVAFLQGWLSFDYFFLVTLAPLPFWILKDPESGRRSFGRLKVCLTAAFSGFIAAHLLHFLQVSMYRGSVSAAIADLSGAAGERFGGTGYTATLAWLLEFMDRYTRAISDWRNFGSALLVASTILLILALLKTVSFARLRSKATAIAWRLPENGLRAVWSAFVVSILWIVAMKQHSFHHVHFIPRHFFLFYFFEIFVIFSGFAVITQTKQPSDER